MLSLSSIRNVKFDQEIGPPCQLTRTNLCWFKIFNGKAISKLLKPILVLVTAFLFCLLTISQNADAKTELNKEVGSNIKSTDGIRNLPLAWLEMQGIPFKEANEISENIFLYWQQQVLASTLWIIRAKESGCNASHCRYHIFSGVGEMITYHASLSVAGHVPLRALAGSNKYRIPGSCELQVKYWCLISEKQD